MNLSGFRCMLPTVVNICTNTVLRNVVRNRAVLAASSTVQLPVTCAQQHVRWYSSSIATPQSQSTATTDTTDSKPQSGNAVVNPEFINRNPRNLEFMGLATKRKGYKFQYPPVEFYHRVVFERSGRHTMAKVEHSTGGTVVSASTRETAIARHLYSLQDTSAAVNIGRVLAMRCRESGITDMELLEPEQSEMSPKFTAFKEALEEGGITLSEPEEILPENLPGIDYDNEEAMAELEERRKRVLKLGRWTRMYLKLRAEHRLTRRSRKFKQMFK